MLRRHLIWCMLILTLPCLIEANPWNYNPVNNSSSAENSVNHTSPINLHKHGETKARSIPRFSPNTPYMTEDSLPVPVHGQPSQRYRGYRPPTIPQRRHPPKSDGSLESSRSREVKLEKQSSPGGSPESGEKTSSIDSSSNEKLLSHRGSHSKSRERQPGSDERKRHSNNHDKANGCSRSAEESGDASDEKKSKENSLSAKSRSVDSFSPTTTPSGSIYPTPPALPYQFRAHPTTLGNESIIVSGNGTIKTDLSNPDHLEQHRSQLLVFNGNNSSNRNETEKFTSMIDSGEGRKNVSSTLTFSSTPSRSATRSDSRSVKNSRTTDRSGEEEFRSSQTNRKDESSSHSSEKSEKSSSKEAAEKFRPDRLFEKTPNPSGRSEHDRSSHSARRDDASASRDSGERATRPQKKSKPSGPPGVPTPPQIKYGRKFMREQSNENDSSSTKTHRRPSSSSSAERLAEAHGSGGGRYRPSNSIPSPPRRPPQSRNRNRPSSPNISGSFEFASGSREEPPQKRRPPPPSPPPNVRQKQLFREENRRPPPQMLRPPKGAFPENFPNFSQLFPQFPGFPHMNTFQQQNSKPRI